MRTSAALLLLALIACDRASTSRSEFRWPASVGVPAQTLGEDLSAYDQPRLVIEVGGGRIAAPIVAGEVVGFELRDESLSFWPETLSTLARSGRDDVRLAPYFEVRVATDSGEPPALLGGQSRVLVRVAIDADNPCSEGSSVSRPRSIETLVVSGDGHLTELDRPAIEDSAIRIGSVAIGLEIEEEMFCAVAQ